MREILFRGKRGADGRWMYGTVVFPRSCRSAELYTAIVQIIDGESCYSGIFEVDPETIGQFTGLTDKNGKKIFEGDIVKQTFEKTVAITNADIWDGDEYADLYGEDVGGVVILPSKGACIKNPVIHREVNGETTQDGETAKMYKNICSGRCEVIGNIHDNPELMHK